MYIVFLNTMKILIHEKTYPFAQWKFLTIVLLFVRIIRHRSMRLSAENIKSRALPPRKGIGLLPWLVYDVIQER